jgi:hypothetical protein
VRFAEDALDRRLVSRRRLQREQARGDPLQVAFGLLDEQWTELVL